MVLCEFSELACGSGGYGASFLKLPDWGVAFKNSLIDIFLISESLAPPYVQVEIPSDILSDTRFQSIHKLVYDD